jgi:hypothetical protein
MKDELIRQELPIQSVRERDQDCTATVPINLSILKLPKDVRTDISLIANARDTVREWYNEDMEYYLSILKEDGEMKPWLKNYAEFNGSWLLDGEPDDHGFLTLNWRENGETHNIHFTHIPVTLYNQHNEFKEFYTSAFCRDKRIIEIMYRGILDGEVVFMPPEKMRKYGFEDDIAKIDEKKGIAEVVAHAFCSKYHSNMAKALLLRDFAVFYLNSLLNKVDETIQRN